MRTALCLLAAAPHRVASYAPAARPPARRPRALPTGSDGFLYFTNGAQCAAAQVVRALLLTFTPSHGHSHQRTTQRTISCCFHFEVRWLVLLFIHFFNIGILLLSLFLMIII